MAFVSLSRVGLIVAVLLFAVAIVRGQPPRSCLCSHPNCVNGTCTPPDNRPGCRISSQYFSEQVEVPFIYITQTCWSENDIATYFETCDYSMPYSFKKIGDLGDAEICCLEGDNCNTRELYDRLTGTEQPSDYYIPIIVVLVLVALTILAIIVTTLCCFLRMWRGVSHGLMRKPSPLGTLNGTLTMETDVELSTNESLEDSGSGSGVPMLVARSIARQVTLHEVIGKGRFGQVFKGSFKGEEVAIKIFHPREETSWRHEVDIYQTCLMSHRNILRFIAADNKDTGMQTQLWLVTEFCEYGSLYDLLNQQSVSKEIMLQLCYTAVCGLDHLHSEIVGTECTQSKPMIAHRDLKSRNILVKAEYTCCIADLGLSLRCDRVNEGVEDFSKRSGTKRYLAPEIITEQICFRDFNSFKMADVYSFGLVLWEIARRGEFNGNVEDPELPYFEAVPIDPSFEDMKKVVVVEKRRPTFSNKWSGSEVHQALGKVMKQCWHDDPEARLTTLRIKKSIGNLFDIETKKQDQS